MSLIASVSLGWSGDSETKAWDLFAGSGRAFLAGGDWRFSAGSLARAIVSVAITLGLHFSLRIVMSVIDDENEELHGDLSGGSLRMGCGVSRSIGVDALLSLLELGDITIRTLLDMPQGTQKTK